MRVNEGKDFWMDCIVKYLLCLFIVIVLVASLVISHSMDRDLAAFERNVKERS